MCGWKFADGWLGQLTSALDDGAALAGAWRDELSPAIEPYLHASCLATTPSFLDSHGLRLDFIAPPEEGKRHDTLSALTDTAVAEGLPLHRLERSNQRNFHRLMGGQYGGLVYHHGAGSRAAISFWDEEPTPELMARNRRTGEVATHLLFTDYDRYMGWLAGEETDPDFAALMDDLTAGRLDRFAHVPALPTGVGLPTRALRASVRLARRVLGRPKKRRNDGRAG